MAADNPQDWMREHSSPDTVWYVKRLTGNDTLANRAHQAGPYIPRNFLLTLLPQLNRPEDLNPRVEFDLYIDSHADHRRVRAIWYNNKLRGRTRNETRLTGFGGASSALLDPESTGALTVFAFCADSSGVVTQCHVWVCRNEVEEDLVEDRIGPVEPGMPRTTRPSPSWRPLFDHPEPPRQRCWLEPDDIPSGWLESFPPGKDILAKSMELVSVASLNPGRRLLKRRTCEYQLFESIEHAWYFPTVSQGFASMKAFTDLAQTILQRRKARSGRSLELHVKEIFQEDGMQEDINFSYNKQSDPGRKPDFLFPSAEAYRNPDFPKERLRMLAIKTTCKDRWRQILNEAKRIKHKHLLTLQEGVSCQQFEEMRESKVRLVVPEPLIRAFPKDARPQLQTLEHFIGDVRLLANPNA